MEKDPYFSHSDLSGTTENIYVLHEIVLGAVAQCTS